MIKYNLVCKKCNLTFDSWFASSAECESLKVEKNLMAPKLISKSIRFKNENKNLLKYKKIRKTISKYQKFIRNNFDYVGQNFAYEARSIHYNEKKSKKGIYGTASKKDLKELKEEGIDAQVIPWIESENN